MVRMTKTIVVTGATGTIGRRVVEGLLAKQLPVTGLVRDVRKGDALPAGTTAAVGTFEDRASLERAFAGADVVVLITAANAHAAEQTLTAIAAAKAAKVRKIVRISALKADAAGPTDNTRQHGGTEAALRDSGLTYVILRPHLFLQNLLGFLPALTGTGQLHWGTGDAKMGMIDTRDAADAAIVAATTADFDNQTFELTGPEAIDYHRVAAAISRGLGREVAYVPVSPQAMGETLRSYGADEWSAKLITDYCTAYSAGFGDFTTDNVQRITGHPPRSIDDFVREVLVPAARGG
jgi:uncharacterized protein YbjT (DUF2867 family)